jgi:Leucine-rich repeat (LRR) protein
MVSNRIKNYKELYCLKSYKYLVILSSSG